MSSTICFNFDQSRIFDFLHKDILEFDTSSKAFTIKVKIFNDNLHKQNAAFKQP